MKKKYLMLIILLLGISALFMQTSLAETQLPDNLIMLDKEALYSTNLSGVLKLNTSLEIIADGALDGTKLHGLVLNENLTEIGTQHFARELAYVKESADGWFDDLTVLGTPKFILGNILSLEKYPNASFINSMNFIDNHDSIDLISPCVVDNYVCVGGFYYYLCDDIAVLLCAADPTMVSGAIDIPDEVAGNTVFYISQYAFYNCNTITSVSIPGNCFIHATTMNECPGATLVYRTTNPQMRVALITDGLSVNDNSYNQAVYEAANTYCIANNIQFTYYQPSSDSDTDRVASINRAVEDGYNVLLLPGYVFGPAISAVQNDLVDIQLIAIDVSEGDLGGQGLNSNVVCITYHEELSGFLAGYAAVHQGYRHLGFLGGMAVPAVVRYGYGFLQGCNTAALKLNVADKVKVEYAYANQFYGDAIITANMDTWYQDLNVEIIFACGGGIFTSVGEAACKVPGARIIGVDFDQSYVINGLYGENLTYTSAMKSLGHSVQMLLSEISSDNFSAYGGKVINLGIESNNPEENYVQLAPTTQFSNNFSKDDYFYVLSKIVSKQIVVFDSIDRIPSLSITIEQRPLNQQFSPDNPDDMEGGEEWSCDLLIQNETMRIALITDYGSIDDHSYNQAAFDAIEEYCIENGIFYSYYRPMCDSDSARLEKIENAINNGNNIIILPGYTFGSVIGTVQDMYSDVIFILLDVTKGDLNGAMPNNNVVCVSYKEELGGFLAGYAVVHQGYRHLGFLGGMEVPAVVRYGYGFIQGCNTAAMELGITDQVTLEYSYGNQFYGDADITAYMDTWYQNLGVEVVFACGGGIFTSVGESASKVAGARVIGVDVDQCYTIDSLYGNGITYTSATKNLGYTIKSILAAIAADNFSSYGGRIINLGVNSVNPNENFVQLAPSTQFSNSFTETDYQSILAKIVSGEVLISNNLNSIPNTSIIVNHLGLIK